MSAEKASAGGYDSPVSQREEDLLDRWRLASEVLDILREAPPEWSVRVGVYGPWGEGKTSVLRFLETMALGEGHVVVWFNPWAARDRQELWLEFAARLVERLEEAKIAVDGVFKPRWRAAWHRLVEPFAEARDRPADLQEFSRTALGGSLSLVGHLLHVDGATLKNIRAALGDKRVIVIVDDLDRADPRLIPHLLLTLREVLDIPGFSFVLAFDADMVARALSDYHTAWASGFQFLEKIIDFPVYLPPLSPSQRRRLLTKELGRCCDFIDAALLDEVEDLLPYNPRKLKLLLRNLSVLKVQVDRHDGDELDWVSILIAQLIKLESEPFLKHFVADSACEEVVVLARHRAPADGEPSPGHAPVLDSLLERAEVRDHGRRERLKLLVAAWASRNAMDSIEALRYQVQLADRPHSVTWKEFRGFFLNHWKPGKQVSDINFWVTHHATNRSTSSSEVAAQLYDTALMYREDALMQAAESTELDEQEEALVDAASCLELIQVLWTEGLKCVGEGFFATAENFVALLDAVERWLAVHDSPKDATAREQERRVLRRCVDLESADAVALLEAISPWAGPELAPASAALRDDLAARLEPRVAAQVLALFGQRGGLSRLREPGKKLGHKYVLLRCASPLWTAPLRTDLSGVLAQAGRDPTVHRNCVDLIALLGEACEGGVESVTEAQARELLGSPGVVELLWQAVLARRIQARAAEALLGRRARLISLGLPEASVPIPGWLARGGAG
jgi:hypothetical protein